MGPVHMDASSGTATSALRLELCLMRLLGPQFRSS